MVNHLPLRQLTSTCWKSLRKSETGEGIAKNAICFKSQQGLLLHENQLSLKSVCPSADCKFRASESFKSHSALEGSLPDTDARQLPICIYNQCLSDADVRLGKWNTGSDHLCNSFPASASPGCGSPAAYADLSPHCCGPAPILPLPGVSLILQ